MLFDLLPNIHINLIKSKKKLKQDTGLYTQYNFNHKKKYIGKTDLKETCQNINTGAASG